MLSQLHWGGGTPTYYSEADLERLFSAFRRRFSFSSDAEIAIEVDARVTTLGQIATLHRLGFNRLSLGIQDFDPKVQKTVGRLQSYPLTRRLADGARAAGFDSVNVDLIYGLPHQTTGGFARTLEQVIEMRPERIAVYSFAYMPWLKPHMKKLPAEALPPRSGRSSCSGSPSTRSSAPGTGRSAWTTSRSPRTSWRARSRIAGCTATSWAIPSRRPRT